MARLFANNATTTLAVTLEDTDMDLTVLNGTGGAFPALDFASDGNWMDMTLEDVNGNVEIVRCIYHAASSNDFQLSERGVEGSTVSTFNVGARVELRLTAAALNGWLQRDGDTIDGGDF